MPYRVSRRRSPAISASRRRRPPSLLRHSKPPKQTPPIRRTSSEPILWTVQFLPDLGNGKISLPIPLPRPHTCTDVFAPSLLRSLSRSPRQSMEGDEVKVVVSVTVEGSPGPVREMVRLGASVQDAIAAVVDRYGREGRSPRIDPAAAAQFQLHHSHFSLQSLQKDDKIGNVGSRSFYLRTNSGSSAAGSDRPSGPTGSSSTEIRRCDSGIDRTRAFFAFIVKKLSKLGRRTRRLCRVLLCITTC